MAHRCGLYGHSTFHDEQMDIHPDGSVSHSWFYPELRLYEEEICDSYSGGER